MKFNEQKQTAEMIFKKTSEVLFDPSSNQADLNKWLTEKRNASASHKYIEQLQKSTQNK